MEFNTSDAERTYSSLAVGINTFIMNAFANAEQNIRAANEQIKKLTEEVKRLKEKYEPEKKEE